MGQSPDVKFIHLRRTETAKDGSERISCRGGLTIAYVPNDAEGTSYKVASARCHWRDNFNRKIGRIKAAGRLLSKQAETIHVGESTLMSLLESQGRAEGFVRQYGKRRKNAEAAE